MNSRDGSVISQEQVESILVQQTSPKVNPEDLEANILKEEFFRWPDSMLITCKLTLKNGFDVTGESACASPENFNEEVGKSIARRNAKDKMWSLLGYELKTKLAMIQAATPPSILDAKTYVGTKVVHATPMNRLSYNIMRGWDVPENEDPLDAGYLVEYTDGGKPNHPDCKGYISWFPQDVFEKAYNVGITLKKTTHVERMVKELEELNDKIVKLQAFLLGSIFEGLPAMDKVDLKAQLTAMENYSWHLGKRMSRAST